MQTPTNQNMLPLKWVDVEFNNFDHFNKAVQEWEIDFHHLDGKPFHSRIQQIVLPELHIGHTFFNNHIDQKGKSPKNMWAFVIMGKESSMFNFNHQETKSTSTMLIYAPGQEINVVNRSGFEIYILSVEKTHFKKIAAGLGFNDIENKLSKIDRVELEIEQANSLREQLKNILNYVASLDQKMLTTQGRSLFLELLPTKFLKEISLHAGCTPKRVFKKRHLLYMESRAYIHTHAHLLISVASIAKKFELSEKTLRNYFQDEFGISPKQYITTLRLQRVKETLKSKPTASIEQIARKQGFNHMGQFANSYKKLFDELPSETLDKK